MFLWAFMDKLLGLGFSTCAADSGSSQIMCGDAWLRGGSPTTEFLRFGVDGPFQDIAMALAGTAWVDWVFMLGLLLGGVALLLGIGVKLAVAGSVILLITMWVAVIPPENHPFLTEHIIYILVVLAALFANQSQRLGLGPWWRNTRLVRRVPVLE